VVLGKQVKHLKQRENQAFELFHGALTETLDRIQQIRAPTASSTTCSGWWMVRSGSGRIRRPIHGEAMQPAACHFCIPDEHIMKILVTGFEPIELYQLT
jgi:hypothetical protein